MISQHQAAPSRYQHIISGLVQPLNHARHRNPLVSVTFSPTQETRSQSAIWMLCPLSFHFPYRFFFLPFHKTFPNTAFPLTFLSFVAHCVFHIVSGQQSPCVSSQRSISFIPPKNIFSHHALAKKMYSIRCIAYKAILQSEKWHTPTSIMPEAHVVTNPDCIHFPGNWCNFIQKNVQWFTFIFFFILLVCINYMVKYSGIKSYNVSHKPHKQYLNIDVDVTNIFCLCLCADYFCL